MSDNNLGVKDEFFESMLSDFLDESCELLEQLNENLLRLDEWASELVEGETARCDEDLMNEMFRAAHSFKGLSGMLGLEDINNLTHKIENVFDAARNDQLAINSDVVELIFQSVDRLVGMVECLKDPNADKVECEGVLADIQTLLETSGVERGKSSQEDTEAAFAAAMEEAARAPSATETNDSASTDDTTAAPEDSANDLFAKIVDDENISPKYLSIFIDEAESSLDDLTEGLLASEGECGVESLLITCHRIKGSAASIGLNRAARLAHYMEDLLQELQQSSGQFTPDMADAMLRCADSLRTYVDGLKSGDTTEDDFELVCQELLTARTKSTTQPGDEPVQEPATETSKSQADDSQPASELSDATLATISAAAPAGTTTAVGQITFEAGLPLVGLKAQLAFEKISQAGQVFFCQPTEAELEDAEELTTLTFGVATEEDASALHNRLRIDGIASVDIRVLEGSSSSAHKEVEVAPKAQDTPEATNVSAETASPSPQEIATANTPTAADKTSRAAVSTTAAAKPAETVRVDIDRLDQLMNLAGQLVINKARFSQIGDHLKHFTASKQGAHSLSNAFSTLDRLGTAVDTYAEKPCMHPDFESLSSHARRIRADLESVQREVDQYTQMRTSVNELLEAVHQLDRVADGIQKSVMDTRMVPVGPLFNRFKRVIRDITRDNGKDIRLEIRGEKTELDKRMIDELGDPLIHMIRNSADHGVESPEDREAAGKPRQGTVTLDAYHRGNSIVIQICDDGKGLAPEKIRAKAIEKGIISQADADKLTQHQMFQLIWEPGLSTAEKVTQVSGRGMGMDIVRSKIEELSGAVELDSTVGVGTTITIKLPLTLAILPSLLADIDGDVFAMPVESVVEIVRVEPKDISTVHGQTTACVRGRIVSVVALDKLFTWNQPATNAAEKSNDDTTLVIVGSEGQEIGLVVDDLLGEEDIVIKSMAENYQNVTGVAGASILGDGRVSLILDVNALVESASHKSTVS